MKVKTPSSTKVSKQGVIVGGALVGGMLSNGVAKRVPGGKITKIGIAVIAAICAASIQGQTTGADAARGALLGMSIEQAGSVAMEAVDGWVNTGEMSKAKEVVGQITGLAGGYEYPPMEYIESAPVQQQLGTPLTYAGSAPFGM